MDGQRLLTKVDTAGSCVWNAVRINMCRVSGNKIFPWIIQRSIRIFLGGGLSKNFGSNDQNSAKCQLYMQFSNYRTNEVKIEK